jgi:hypothetical protein
MIKKFRFQFFVCRFGNAETGIENVLQGLDLLRNVTILTLETGGEFWLRQFPTCFDRMKKIYGIFNRDIGEIHESMV